MNKKGFVLAETLVVTIFVLIIFTLLYNSAVPLLGRYETLSYYNDLNTTYDLYHLRKLITNDSHYQDIKNTNYSILKCDNLDNEDNKCTNLFELLEINSMDELIYIKSGHINDVKDDNSISLDVKDYLKHINPSGDILVLQNDGYVSYLGFPKTFREKVLEQDQSVCKTFVEEDGIIYISGSKECINFNYVWYSGKMWRITAIYPDGAMKLITDNNMTSISYGENSTYYDKLTGAKSYVFQWLNEDFLDNLVDYEKIIDDTKTWNASAVANIGVKPDEIDDTTISASISPIGLLNSYEYYKSYQNMGEDYANGYLNKGYNFFLLDSDVNGIKSVSGGGKISKISPSANRIGIRPSIYIKSDMLFFKGEGTFTNPYIIETTNSQIGKPEDFIYGRISGEYVKISSEENSESFRIVVTENNTTKIVSTDYADSRNLRMFSNSENDVLWGNGTTTDNNTWYTYLNNTYYQNLRDTYGDLFDNGLYYLGKARSNYKLSICSDETTDTVKNCTKTSLIKTLKIGLLRYGEMFATQQPIDTSPTIAMWLINSCYHSATTSDPAGYTPCAINNNGTFIFGNLNYEYSTTNLAARPTLYLKSTVKIVSGTGLPNDPYIVE